MFASFKNTELFRYFVRVDLNNGIDKILKQNKSSFSLIAGSIFSGSFSILGTYFGMKESEYSSFCKIVITSALFALLFVIGMGLFKGFIFLGSFVCNALKKEKVPSKAKIKELIDDFDHIACDNILISQNFINAYNDKNTSILLKEFYFYEIVYYTNVSLSIIQKLIYNKNLCINDKNNTNRVHLFRLENALFMLNDIYTFINENKEKNGVDAVLQPSVNNMVSELKNKLNNLSEQCEKIKKEKYISN